MDVNGVSRHTLVYVPASRVGTAAVPAIVVLHGAGGSGAQGKADSLMDVEAERLGFVVAYPDGIYSQSDRSTHWNDGRPVWGTDQPPDDVSFIGKLFDLLINKYTVDPTRIAVAGLSNGSFMAGRLVCDLPDRVAAIAVISGARDDSACAPQRPISVLVIHGTADPLQPYAGGPDSRQIPVPAETDVVTYWRTHDGCAAQPTTSAVTTTVKLDTYGSCQGGNEVRFYTVVGGGHMWPHRYDISSFEASPDIADFLLAHPLPTSTTR